MPDQESRYKPVVEIPNYSQPIMPELPGATALLKEAWAIYKSRFKVFIGIALIPALITLISLAIYLIPSIGNAQYLLAFLPWLIWIIIIIFGLWSQIALIFAIRDRAENITIGEAFKRGKNKISDYFLINILVGLIVLAGTILFIIPGVIFAIWYSLSGFVFVSEDLKGMAALSKSKQYVSGYSLSVLWRMIFIGLLVFLIGILVSSILSPFKIVLHPLGFMANSSNITVNISDYLLQIFIYPLITVYAFLIYSHLKRIKGI